MTRKRPPQDKQPVDHQIEPLIESGLRFPLGVKHVAGPTPMATSCAKTVNAIFLRDGRQIQMCPTTLLQEMTDEVIGMEPLHDDDYRAFGLMVEPR
jgi:hypothetical protein